MKNAYAKKRQELIAKAESLIAENKIQEAEDVMKEVEKLDADYENTCRAQANLKAMQDKVTITDIENKSVNPEKTKKLASTTNVEDKDDKSVYENAFMKYLQNRSLDKKEQEVFDRINIDIQNAVQGTSEHSVLIPESVVEDIWKEIGELHPILGDIEMTFVPGSVKLIKETSSGDKAKFYDEATATEEGSFGFGSVILTGCELAKDVTVSWSLKKMTPDKFLAYIKAHLAEKMADGLAYGVVEGKGKPGPTDTFKPEPKGIVTVILAESSTPQVLAYSVSDPVTYKKLTALNAKVKSGYFKDAAYYANNEFIWNVLANVADEYGRPIFVTDPTNEGVGRLFGRPVKEEDGIPADCLLLGNAFKGYLCNVNENMTIYQEDHVKERKTDYMEYSLVDGDLKTTKAFAYLQKEAEEEGSSS